MFLIRRPLQDKELRNFEHYVIRRFLFALHGDVASRTSATESISRTFQEHFESLNVTTQPPRAVGSFQ